MLAQLKKQGLGVCALECVYNTIVLSTILYALLVYFGYLTKGHTDMLRRVLKRANRMGFAFHGYDLNKLNETSQDKLFRHCRSEQRCLRHLLSSNPDRLVPCILDNVGTTLSYQISNMILINATLLLVHCFIMSKFYAFVVPSVL